ncbi:hypothetical protein [Mycobacterium sp. NPDC050853]|uniref:hypothetical protein n=1 Tax=Mycobacterium sp. NPDC050853 TaxID=3155160 RepID=UPI00340B1584
MRSAQRSRRDAPYVERRRSATDRRRHIVALTDAGARMLDDVEHVVASIENRGGASQRFFLALARHTGMSPDNGALSQLRAATDPTAKGGQFYGPLFANNGAPISKPILRRFEMSRAIAKLWEVSERETGVPLNVHTSAGA